MTMFMAFPAPVSAWLRKSDRVWLADRQYVLSMRTGWVYVLADSEGRRLDMPHPVLVEHLASGLARIEYGN